MEKKVQTGGGGESIELHAIQPSTLRKRKKKTKVTQRKRFRSLMLETLRKRKLGPQNMITSETARARRLVQLRRLERSHVRKELSPFYQLRSRARQIYNRIENAISTAVEKVERKYEQCTYIPITLLKLEDPGLDFETYQYFMERIFLKHNQIAYEDWAWFRARGAPPGARGQRRAQRHKAELAQVPGVRPLQDDERKALANAAFRYYDPDDNRLRILSKFHKERRELVTSFVRPRRKPSWIFRYATRTRRRRFRSPRINIALTYLTTGRFQVSSSKSTASDDYDNSLENLPTFPPCSENPLNGRHDDGLPPSCLPLKLARWWSPPARTNQDKVIPVTPPSFSASSDDNEEFETTSSSVPGDPYENVFIVDSEKANIPPGSKIFRDDELHLLRPYGEKRPVFVYNMSLERAVKAQEREALRSRHARPPCLCRPGFPRKGLCRRTLPVSNIREAPHLKWCVLLLIFFIKLCLMTAIAFGMLYFFLKSKGYTNITPVPIVPQKFFNTYIDLDDTCKYFIFNNTLRNTALQGLKVRAFGPFLRKKSDDPYFNHTFVRLYYKNENFDRTNVTLLNVDRYLYSEEVHHKSYSYNYTNTTRCAEDEDLKTAWTDYEYMFKTDIQSISYSFGITWSYSHYNFTLYIKTRSSSWTRTRWHWLDGPVTEKRTNSYKYSVTSSKWYTQHDDKFYVTQFISDFALWFRNQSLEKPNVSHIVRKKEPHSVKPTPITFRIINVTCYYSYSRLNVTLAEMKINYIDWNRFHFCDYSKDDTDDDIDNIPWIPFDDEFSNMETIPGRIHENHSVFGNSSGIHKELTVIYAFKYCANFTVNSERKYTNVSVAFAIDCEMGHDLPYTTTTTKSPPTYVVKPDDGVKYVFILIGGLYVLLLLQVHRTSAVVIIAIAGITVLSYNYVKPEEKDVRSYFEFQYVLPYVFVMMCNACLSDTGLYDVFAIYSVKYLKKFAIIVPMLWLFVVGTTFLTDNVTAMMCLTPIAIRIFEELKLDPQPVLRSMIMMANVMAVYTGDGSLYNQMLIDSFGDYVKEVLTWKNVPFYKQNSITGLISFVVSIVYFTSYFFIFKTYMQKQNGLNVLKHELNLWNRIDGSHSSGGGMNDFMQTSFTDERHGLIRVQNRGGLPVRLYERHTRIREGAGRILAEMGCLMIVFSVLYYYRTAYIFQISFSSFRLLRMLALLGLYLMLRADISWSTPFNVILQRMNLSTIFVIMAFFFLGNISSALSAVFGLGATRPLVQTLILLGDNMKGKILKDTPFTRVYGDSILSCVRATTLGVNIGGTASMLGSVTALATAGAADMQGHHLGMVRYILVMLPVTALNIGFTHLYSYYMLSISL